MIKQSKGELSKSRVANMRALTEHVISVLRVKNPKYGESWKSKGGFSAFFNLDRKWSRVETLAAKYNYDIFLAIQETMGEPDGMVEALADLMGYDVLILDDQCQVDAAVTGEYPTKITTSYEKAVSGMSEIGQDTGPRVGMEDSLGDLGLRLPCDRTHELPVCEDLHCHQRIVLKGGPPL